MDRAQQFISLAKNNIVYWHPDDEIIDIINSTCEPQERRLKIDLGDIDRSGECDWSSIDSVEQFLNDVMTQDGYIQKVRVVGLNSVDEEATVMLSFADVKHELMWYRASEQTPAIQPVFRMNIKELVYEYSEDTRRFLDSHRDLNPNAWWEYAPRFSESIEWDVVYKELDSILTVDNWS